MDNVVRLPQVQQVTGAKRSTIYKWIAQGLFPRPIKVGMRSVGWLESEVEQWLAVRIADSRPAISMANFLTSAKVSV